MLKVESWDQIYSPDYKNPVEQKEKEFTCKHGHTMSWAKARNLLKTAIPHRQLEALAAQGKCLYEVVEDRSHEPEPEPEGCQ